MFNQDLVKKYFYKTMLFWTISSTILEEGKSAPGRRRGVGGRGHKIVFEF